MNDFRDFRSELPFGDEVLRDLRADVMKQIERDASRPSRIAIVFRFALAAAAVLLVTRIVEPPPNRVPQRTRVAVTIPPAPRAASPVTTIASRTETHTRPAVRTRSKPHVPVAIATTTAPVRIEIHTSNPDIRILWINQPDSNEPSGETR